MFAFGFAFGLELGVGLELGLRLGLVLGLLRPAALDQLEVALRRQRRALLLDDGLGELRQRIALPGHLGREHLPRDDPEGVDLARLVRVRAGVG